MHLAHTAFKMNHDRCADPLAQVAGPGEPRATIPMISSDQGPQSTRVGPRAETQHQQGRLPSREALYQHSGVPAEIAHMRPPFGAHGAGPPPPGSVDTRGLLAFGDPITEAWAVALSGSGRSIGGGSGQGTGRGAGGGTWSFWFRQQLLPAFLVHAPPGSACVRPRECEKHAESPRQPRE